LSSKEDRALAVGNMNGKFFEGWTYGISDMQVDRYQYFIRLISILCTPPRSEVKISSLSDVMVLIILAEHSSDHQRHFNDCF